MDSWTRRYTLIRHPQRQPLRFNRDWNGFSSWTGQYTLIWHPSHRPPLCTSRGHDDDIDPDVKSSGLQQNLFRVTGVGYDLGDGGCDCRRCVYT